MLQVPLQRAWARARVCVLVFAGLTGSGASALAQAPTTEDADGLFNAGRELMQQNRFADACPKFAQSQRLLPAVGTALNLGLCLEKLGHTASAVAAYRDAITMATALGPAEAKRITVARDRLASLEPRLQKLQIVVTEDAAGLEVKRDGLALGKTQYGTWLPVDPVPHVIEATAPGKQSWKTTIAITGEAAAGVVTVPALLDVPRPTVAAVTPGRPTASSRDERVERPLALTAVLGGVGVVGLTAGIVLALDARSKYNDADSLCDARGCAPQAASIQDGALARGNLATVAFVLGGAALAGAAFVWFVFPGARHVAGDARTARRSPLGLGLGLGPGGLVAGGAF